MIPELCEMLVEVGIKFGSMELHVVLNNFSTNSKGSSFIEEELAIGYTKGVSFQSIFGNEGVHKSVITLSSESLWHRSRWLVEGGTNIWDSKCRMENVWGWTFLARPWALDGVWSILLLLLELDSLYGDKS